MRKVIQNERRIELAFEEHRYWDIRRWRLAEQVYAQPIQGMYITKSQTSTTYVPQAVLNVQWDNKRYFYPIPYSECRFRSLKSTRIRIWFKTLIGNIL